MSLVHYRPPQDDTGVVCGATPPRLEFTRIFSLVTCFACRRNPTFRLDQLGLDSPATDVRPSVGTICRIKSILREYDQALHTAEDALSIIGSIVNGKENP